MNIIFRALEESDFSEVLQLALAAWMFAYGEIFEVAYIENFVSHHYGAARLRALLSGVRRGTTWFDVALQSGHIIGLCSATVARRGIELNRLYLHPDARGQGVASGLLLRLEDFVRLNGKKKYHCFVHRQNELGKRFYLKRGFRHIRWQDTAEDWRLVKHVDQPRGGVLRILRGRMPAALRLASHR